MLSGEVELNDYYGYNSIIDGQGKRIRRMRRTEASAQKLMHERVKSPCLSRDPSNKSRTSPIQQSYLSASINRHDSGLKFYREKITSQKIQKKKQEYYSASNLDNQRSKGMIELQSNHHLRTVGNFKEAMGDYYLWNQQKTTQKQTKQPLKSFSSYQRQTQTNEFRPSETREGFGNTTVKESSRRTLKKTQKSYEIRPFQLEENPKRIVRKHLKQQAPPSLLKKRQSNIQSNISKSNNGKLSEVSSVSKKNSRISQSVVSNSQRIITKPLKKNHVKFEQQSLKSGDMIKSNSIHDDYSQKQSISKRSSVNIELPSQSSQSQVGSHISSYASTLRSKIKQSQERSKISNLIEDSGDVEVNSPIPRTRAAMMTKKSTETTQSDENHRKGNQIYKASRKFVQDESFKRSFASNQQKQSNIKPEGSNLQVENEQSSIQSQVSKHKSRQRPNTQQKNMRFSMSSSNQKHGQLQQSLKFHKKKSLSSYTFNDVAQNIEEHDIRICSIYLFVDSTRSLNETPLKFERYERLCFLMLKKYKNQKIRIVKSLQGDKQSCFTLMDAEIPSQVLSRHINRQEVRERLNAFVEQEKKVSRQVEDFYNDINKKYQKDKYMKLEMTRYAFEPEIMRLLMEELNKLYLELQKEDIQNEIIDSNQQRIIQIVEIMFLMSELNGRFVKKFQLFDENQVDFQEYYTRNYEKIMETAEYFEKEV